MGRKNKYETNVKPFISEISKWVEDMSEAQIAKKLGVAESSFNVYKQRHEELRRVLRKGREDLINELKESLKKKAKGFRYHEVKTTTRENNGVTVVVTEVYERYSPPDTGAIHLLLKNLDPDWTNDDKETMKIKKEQIELQKKKIEAEEWK